MCWWKKNPMTYFDANNQEVQLVLDVWEGQPEIDPEILKAGNVAAMFIRLNHISGGHHKDLLFDKTWQLYKDFMRCPYFVFNPWVSGEANYKWLAATVPPESPCVATDIEVIYSELNPAEYAAELDDYVRLRNLRWKSRSEYTGEWFLNYVDHWPNNDYWWAQYTRSMYPGPYTTTPWKELPRVSVSWDELHALVKRTKWPPVNSAKCPGNIRLWQCSGDKLILPGSTRPVDVNLFRGTKQQLGAWLGLEISGEPTPVLTREEKFNELYRQALLHDWSLLPL